MLFVVAQTNGKSFRFVFTIVDVQFK